MIDRCQSSLPARTKRCPRHRQTDCRRLLVLVGLMLGILLLISHGLLAQWELLVEPDVVLLVQHQVAEERVIVVCLTDEHLRASDEQGGTYAYEATLTWHSDRMAEVRRSLSEWGVLLPAGWARSAQRGFWEVATPYIAFANAVLLRCRTSDIPLIAELPCVKYIYDAERPVDPPAELVPEAQTAEAEGTSVEIPRYTSSADLAGHARGRGLRVVDVRSIAASWMDLGEASDPASDAPILPSGVVDIVGYGMTRGLAESAQVPTADWPLALSFDQLLVPPENLSLADYLSLAELGMRNGATHAMTAAVSELGERSSFLLLIRGLSDVSMSAERSAVMHGAPSLVATMGSHAEHVVLEWSHVVGAEAYEILRSSADDVACASMALVSGNRFEDAEVETCTQYTYRVRGIGSAAIGHTSLPSTGYVGEVPHHPVRQVVATDGTQPNGILVEWDPVETATEYYLLRAEPVSVSTQASSKLYIVYRGSEPSYLDRDVVPGTTYFYRVRARNGCGGAELSPRESGYALFVSAASDPLSPPAWLSASLIVPEDRITIMWSAVEGASQYRIYRAESYDGPYEVVWTTGELSWDDATVAQCRDVWYRIRAVSGDTGSPLSAVAHGMRGGKPSAPKTGRASDRSYKDVIRLEWESVPGATSYTIRRATTPDGSFALVGETMGTVFLDEALPPDQEFWYKIYAANGCGSSGGGFVLRGATADH